MRGLTTLIEAIRAEAPSEFPMDLQAVDYAFGDIEIDNESGGVTPVRDLTERLEKGSYDTPDELIEALTRVISGDKAA